MKTTFMRFSFTALFAVVSVNTVLGYTHAQAGEADNTPPIVLDKYVVTAKADDAHINEYQARMDSLFAATRTSRKMRYRDVLKAVYDTRRFDLDKALEAKKAYRDSVVRTGDHVFMAHYELLDEYIPLGDPRDNEERSFVLYTLGVNLGVNPSPETVDRLKAIEKKFGMYEASVAVNFPGQTIILTNINNARTYEAAMQDLNRFYATIKGHPIMNPAQALEAFVLMGTNPPFKLIKKIFAENGVATSDDEIKGILSGRRVAKGQQQFMAGYCLCQIFENERNKTGGRYSPQLIKYVLMKILIEAPGHI